MQVLSFTVLKYFLHRFSNWAHLLDYTHKDTKPGKYLHRSPIKSRLEVSRKRAANPRNHVFLVLFAKSHICVSGLSSHIMGISQPMVNHLPPLHSNLERGTW